MELPYVTSGFAGIGGTLKQRPEDFFVQELPLYEPSGEGEHVFCEIQKTQLTTFQAIDRFAKALNVSPRDIGYAGMKDAQAVTRQHFSILGTTPEAVMALSWPDLTVLWALRHGNKLRLGHLAGNRFAIKLRDVNPTDVVKLTPLVEVLQKRGMPNFFGEQRFGRRGDNDKLGAALVRGDNKSVMKLLLGSSEHCVDDTEGARKAYDSDNLELAMKLYPRHCGMERRVLSRFLKTRRPGASVRLVDDRIQRLWVTALQSSIFNQVVSVRIATLDQLMTGDLAYKHENGAAFLVEDAAVEQPRAERFEISPTGPLIGYRMTAPQGQPLEIEQKILDAEGLKAGDFRAEGRLRIKGARRPLRVRPENVELSAGVDEHGAQITAAFTLPAGSYATVFLRELTKDQETIQSDAAEVASE